MPENLDLFTRDSGEKIILSPPDFAEVNARLVWTDLQSKGLVSIERSIVATLLSTTS